MRQMIWNQFWWDSEYGANLDEKVDMEWIQMDSEPGVNSNEKEDMESTQMILNIWK